MTKKEENFLAGYSYDEWERMEKQFEKDYANSSRYNQSFREMINDILEGENEKTFNLKTGLSENMFSRIRNKVDVGDPPKMNTLISICIGYDVDVLTAQSLLRCLGLSFNRHNRRDYAYSFLLTRCRGRDWDECNQILEKLGIEKKYWLGSQARKRRKKKI